MIDAFVMIDTATGASREVCRALRDAPGVADARVVAGDFDVVVELIGDEPRDLLATVTESIRPLEGVGATRTYVCID